MRKYTQIIITLIFGFFWATAHATEKTIYTCNSCPRNFKWLSNLREHERIHSGEKPYTCTDCDQRFTVKGQLKQHRQRKHDPSPPQWQCETCPAIFKMKGDLTRHKITHLTEKLFVCKTCNRGFSAQSSWHRHQQVHMKAKQRKKIYRCEECRKAFPKPSELKRHEDTHWGLKSCMCSVCFAEFSQQGNLDRHIKNMHAQPAGSSLELDDFLENATELEAEELGTAIFEGDTEDVTSPLRRSARINHNNAS